MCCNININSSFPQRHYPITAALNLQHFTELLVYYSIFQIFPYYSRCLLVTKQYFNKRKQVLRYEAVYPSLIYNVLLK